MTKARAVLFIDGSNFYHSMRGAGIAPRGLDFLSFSQKLVGAREWVETRYYIGEIKKDGDVSLYEGQQRFLGYLRSQERIKVLLGRMERQPIQGVKNKFAPWKEKAVDVMIASDIISMAYEDKYDVAYLLSNDGDFTPVVGIVRALKRKVFVASPVLNNAAGKESTNVIVQGYEISQAADTFIPLKREFFNDCWRG